MDQPRLLIVDDHPDTLELFAVMLGDRYRVVTCPSAAEALAILDVARPDVVVLDIGMAPINGIECLARIRAVPGYAGVPAIALTGWARDDDRKRFLDAGFQAVLAKPVLDEPLLAAVESVLSRGSRPHVLTGDSPVGTLSNGGNGVIDPRGTA